MTAFVTPSTPVAAPAQTEVVIAETPVAETTRPVEAPRQIKSVNLSGKFMLIGKSGKPFNGYVLLENGIVKLSYNGKVVNPKIANGTFLTTDGDQIRIFKSIVTGYQTKSQIDAQPQPQSKPIRVKRTSSKKQLADLLEANNKLLTMFAAHLSQPVS